MSGVHLGLDEATFAVCGLVVVSVHVLDDNFLQPERGTSAGDHLVSGLLPLTVLLAVAALYSCRPAPACGATLAAVLGLFGVVTGIEAVYYLDAARVSGDDYTGLAAIAAGSSSSVSH